MPRKRLMALAAAAVCLAALLTWANAPDSPPLPPGAVADRVVVAKHAHTLTLMRGTRPLKTYRVSLGPHPRGQKEREGDGRTPEGLYRLDSRNAHSGMHLALHVSYPDSAAVAHAKVLGVSPGGLIMVHGIRNGLGWIGRMHRWVDWTNGCVAVTDREMDEIWRAVPTGTPVEIRP
jgi:murein L,D-transpeptidase YafK